MKAKSKLPTGVEHVRTTHLRPGAGRTFRLAKLADLLAAVGKNLELHHTSLDPEEEVSRPEIDAYTSLVK